MSIISRGDSRGAEEKMVLRGKREGKEEAKDRSCRIVGFVLPQKKDKSRRMEQRRTVPSTMQGLT